MVFLPNRRKKRYISTMEAKKDIAMTTNSVYRKGNISKGGRKKVGTFSGGKVCQSIRRTSGKGDITSGKRLTVNRKLPLTFLTSTCNAGGLKGGTSL